MKKSVGLSILILGAFIGAGFSSGREVYVFFARFGWLAIPMAVFVGMCLYLLFMYFLNLSPHKNSTIYKIFEVVINISTFILCSTMFAGCKALTDMIGFWILALTLIVPIIQCFARLDGLKIVNYILLPLILVCISVLAVISPLRVVVVGANLAFSSCAKYVGLNCILLSMFLIQIGENYTLKEKKIASIISSTMLTFFIILISLVIMGMNSSVVMSNMPLVTLAFSKGKALGFVISLVVWAGLITTLVSGLFVIINTTSKVVGHRSKSITNIVSVAVVLICFAFSFVGWDFLTGKAYSVTGLISIIVIVGEILNEFLLGGGKIQIYKKNKK